MTDQLLIDLYFARDKRAVAETKEKYGAWCAAIAWRLLRDSRDVEECLSDCALAVWNAIPPQRPEHFKGWLGAIKQKTAYEIGVRLVGSEMYIRDRTSLFRTRNKLREYLHQEGYLWWTRSGRWRRWAISTRS